jgi:hypothetical protein
VAPATKYATVKKMFFEQKLRRRLKVFVRFDLFADGVGRRRLPMVSATATKIDLIIFKTNTVTQVPIIRRGAAAVGQTTLGRTTL